MPERPKYRATPPEAPKPAAGMADLRHAPSWIRIARSIIRRLPAGRYRLAERLSRKPPSPFVATAHPAFGSFAFECDLRDSISREVCFTGCYEPQETLLVREILKPGMTFVDVGANWGYFTLLAAHLVGPQGTVVAIEPDPRMFAKLEANVLRNGFRNVTLHPFAAAAADGHLPLQVYDEAAGNFGLSHLLPGSTDAGAVSVRIRPLDSVLDALGLGVVDLLKMDIEGAEGLALQGLARSLEARRVTSLLLELHPRALEAYETSLVEIFDLLTSAGYTSQIIDHSPKATRRVAYGQISDAGKLLRSYVPRETLDAWPHLLWRHTSEAHGEGAPRSG